MKSLYLAAALLLCLPMTASAQFFPGWGWWTNPGGEVGEVPDPMDFSVMTNPMISNFLTTGPALGYDPTDVDGNVSQSNFHPISGVTGDDETIHPRRLPIRLSDLADAPMPESMRDRSRR